MYSLLLVGLLSVIKSNNGEAHSAADVLKQELSKISMQNGLTTEQGDIHEEIWKGFNATRGQFPYQALLINYAQDVTLCGGSLISTTFVLTAAHCSYQTTQTKVFLGLTEANNGNGAVYYDVMSYNTYIHPSYNPKNFQNDLTILKLPGAATLTDLIQTIALPMKAWAPPTTFDNYYVTASGWGQTYNGEQGVHPYLQYRTIHKMPQQACVNYYSTTSNPVTNGMICTDKDPIYAGPCHGDSGGPLTVRLASGLYVIGAVSWTIGECNTSQPIVYANVANYLPWINYVTGIPIK